MTSLYNDERMTQEIKTVHMSKILEYVYYTCIFYKMTRGPKAASEVVPYDSHNSRTKCFKRAVRSVRVRLSVVMVI